MPPLALFAHEDPGSYLGENPGVAFRRQVSSSHLGYVGLGRPLFLFTLLLVDGAPQMRSRGFTCGPWPFTDPALAAVWCAALRGLPAWL